jgi:dienelactone hydrolase
MKQVIFILYTFTSYLPSTAQDSFYNYVELGEYGIGYFDSIIYNSGLPYQQFGYSGPTPIFAKIWFPMETGNSKTYLSFGNVMSDNPTDELSEVYQNLSHQLDEIFIRDGLEFNILTGEPIDYGIAGKKDALAHIKLIKTKCIASNIKSNSEHPVIVYHHGSQGSSIENSIMAEYFASRGYIFVSANFHLPYSNMPFGLLPLELENQNKHDQSTVKTLIQFAKTLTQNNQLYFIGHSWGAQEGWCFLSDSSYAKAFISMETTIEYKTDSTEIKELWPYVYDALKVKRNKFSIPILAFAAKEEGMTFDFFKKLSSKEMIYASYVEPFTHNSYTSSFLMRYFLGDTLKQPDAEIMLTQIKGYAHHLELTYTFLEHQKDNILQTDLTHFNKRFEIIQENTF